MEQPQHGHLDRTHAISLLAFARKAGLANEAMKIFGACVPMDNASSIDWCRAHDELKELLVERGISETDHFGIEAAEV